MADTLPPRPTTADVENALAWAARIDQEFGGTRSGHAPHLAAEVLHLRAQVAELEADKQRLRGELNEEASYGQQLEQRALRAEHDSAGGAW